MMLDNQELFDAHRKAMLEPKISNIDPCHTPYTNTPYWAISLTDGRQASTLNEKVAQEAYRLKGLDLPVRMERQKNQVGYTLTFIAPLKTL